MVFGLCLFTAASVVWAGNRGGEGNGRWAGPGNAWGDAKAGGGMKSVDENGDGVCDYFQGSAHRQAMGRGQGHRKGAVNPGNPGRYYVDENGDGVCDNSATGSKMKKLPNRSGQQQVD